MSGTWYDDNDHGIVLRGLNNGLSGAYVNNATVQVTLRNAGGAELSGISWPVTLVYESGSNGDYIATLDKALDVAPRDRITAKITAVSGTLDAQWDEQINVTKRRSL
jgi:hypothetical protein